MLRFLYNGMKRVKEQLALWNIRQTFKELRVECHSIIIRYKLSVNGLWQAIYRKEKVPPLVDDIGYGETYNWSDASIRRITFHPFKDLQAVVTINNVVLLQRMTPMVILKQYSVNCAAFRPWDNIELALGCAAGLCIWQKDANESEERLLWLNNSCMELDLVVDLQWLSNGIFLVAVLQNSGVLQVWLPDAKQLIKQVCMPSRDSNLWIMRNVFGIDACFENLDRHISVGLRVLTYWEYQLTRHTPLQTAAWTACGSHLLFVPKGSCRLYVSTLNAETAVFIKPELTLLVSESVNLDTVACHLDRRECGEPVAIAVDPYNVFVAVLFKAQPFVLLMLMICQWPSQMQMIPLKFIQCDEFPLPQPEIFASCIAFSCRQTFANAYRCLAIAWSNSYLQVEMFTSTKPHEVLLQTSCNC